MATSPFITSVQADKKIQDSYFALEQQIDIANTGSDLGLLQLTDTPPPTGKHRGDVQTAGTYTNFGGIVFTQLELDNNFGYIYVDEGVSTKILSAKKLPELAQVINPIGTTKATSEKAVADYISPVYNEVFEIENQLSYGIGSSNANGQALSAIIDLPIQLDGKISRLKGSFPAIGNLVFFIANEKTLSSGSLWKFNTLSKHTVAIEQVGENIIDLNNLNIQVKQGQYIGVSTESTAKPYYGIDAVFGRGWYQNAETPSVGVKQTFNFVANACFLLGFEVSKVKVAKQDDVAVLQNTLNPKLKPYEITYPVTTTVNSLLGNLIPNPEEGIINYIRFYANIIGEADFQIFERTTNNSVPGSGNDSFKAIKTITLNSGQIGWNTVYLTEQITLKKEQYIAMCGGTGKVHPSYSAGSGLIHAGWFQGANGKKAIGSITTLSLANGTILVDYELSLSAFEPKKENVVINKISAVKNAENYNSIRNLLTSITDASETNLYEIYIAEGTWNEFDLQGKKFVKLFGTLNGKTIINTDPLGTMSSLIAPADTAYPSEGGKTLGTISSTYLHTIFVKNDIHCENLTFKCQDAKYVVHIDNRNYTKAYFKNCFFIEKNCSYAIGMGINGGQTVEFEKCIIKSENLSLKKGFFYHNSNNQGKGNSVTFDRCKFDNCSYGMIDELGSDQVDFVNVLNCFTTLGEAGQRFDFMVDRNGSTNNTFWTNPVTGLKEPNPINVPYCIVLNTTGTKVKTLVSNDSANFNPAWAGVPHRDVELIKNTSIIEIT